MLRMNCDRPLYTFVPYEILYLVPDNFGKWGNNWKVHSKHNTREERDKAFDELKETSHRRYRKAINEYEYDAMIAAEYRYEQAHKKQDDTDIAGALNIPVGADQKDGYVSWGEL
jgi:hypothetical protein